MWGCFCIFTDEETEAPKGNFPEGTQKQIQSGKAGVEPNLSGPRDYATRERMKGQESKQGLKHGREV